MSVIEKVVTASVVDRVALVIEEMSATYHFAQQADDPVKQSVAHLHFACLMERYKSLTETIKHLTADDIKAVVSERLIHIQTQRAEQIARIRRKQEIEREELALMGIALP